MAKTLPFNSTVELDSDHFDDHDLAGGSAPDTLEIVQVSDQAILAHMRTQPGTSILDLAEKLAVTDTAVRQRLTRLMDRGLVQRYAVREGRGRPKHVYRLTEAGLRASGANLDDLAVALWQELVSLEDTELQERFLRRVVGRLVSRYAVEVTGSTPQERVKSVVELFNRRGIPFAYEQGDVPGKTERQVSNQAMAAWGRLVVLGCPYPGLKDDQRLVCRMEQMLFQRLIGVPLEDVTAGSSGGCCSFVPLQGTLAERAVTNHDGSDPDQGAGKTQAQGGRAQCGKSQCDCH